MANDVQEDLPTGGDSQQDEYAGEQQDQQQTPPPQQQSAAGPLAGTPGNIPFATPPFLPGPSPSQSIQQRQGGLLTGLAGALIDGIAGGMAESPQVAREMPLRMQQMRTQMAQNQLTQQKAQEEMALAPLREKANWMQAQINIQHLQHLIERGNDIEMTGATELDQQMMDDAKKGGYAIPKAGGMSLEEAKDYLRKERANIKNNPDAFYYKLAPDGHDAAGNPTTWSVVWVNPNKTNPNSYTQTVTLKDPNNPNDPGQSFQVKIDGGQPLTNQIAQGGQILTAAVGNYAKTGQEPIFAVDPNAGPIDPTTGKPMGQTVQTTPQEARQKGYTNPIKVKEGDLEKEATASSQLGEVQSQISRYRMDSEAMFRQPMTPEQASALTMLTPEKLGIQLGQYFAVELPEVFQKLANNANYHVLNPEQQKVVRDYYGVQASIPVAQKAMSGVGRLSDYVAQLEARTVPDPGGDPNMFHDMLDGWQQRLDRISSKGVQLKGRGMSPEQVRQSLEGIGPQPTTYTYPPGSAGAAGGVAGMSTGLIKRAERSFLGPSVKEQGGYRTGGGILGALGLGGRGAQQAQPTQQGAGQAAPPPGAIGQARSKVDGKMHWTDGSKDLGVAQ